MSSRGAKGKDKKQEKKLRKAEREAEREERRDRRAAATDGLDGAIAAATVTKRLRTPPQSISPPNKKGPAVNRSPSANGSPVFKRRGHGHRVQNASSSSSSSKDSGEDESSVVGAKHHFPEAKCLPLLRNSLKLVVCL